MVKCSASAQVTKHMKGSNIFQNKFSVVYKRAASYISVHIKHTPDRTASHRKLLRLGMTSVSYSRGTLVHSAGGSVRPAEREHPADQALARTGTYLYLT